MSNLPKVDLEKALLQLARRQFEKHDPEITSEQKKLVRDNFIGFEVDWSGVVFKHSTKECKQHGLAKNNQYIYRFDTTYVNSTSKDQTYNFNVQRRQLAQSRVEMTEGYMTGYESGFSLKTPGEVVEANVGIIHEVTGSFMDEKSIEDESSWTLQNDIIVPKGTQVDVEMTITEEVFDGRFTLETTARKNARVIITNQKNYGAFIKSYSFSIVDIVKHAKENDSAGAGVQVTYNPERGEVTYTSKGKCFFKYGRRKVISVKQKPLSEVNELEYNKPPIPNGLPGQ